LTFRNDLINATVTQAPIAITVPEPSSAVLLIVGMSSALLRRRR